MKKILLVVSIVSFLLVGCAGSFKSQVTKGYLPPQGDQIAMTYLDHADINISNKATEIFQKQLNQCVKTEYIPAEKIDELFQENNIVLPRRLNKSFIKSLKNHISAKYIITGGISIWKEGSIGFPVASSTEVSASITMYDISTGEIVWTVTGQETGGDGIFAESPETKAVVVFRQMLEKWEGFCN